MAKKKEKALVPEGNNTLIEEAVKFINEKSNETVYKGYEEIGNYILEHFFDNDIAKAQSKDPTKKVSFNKLCEREDLIVHPNTLALMMRVACQEKIFVDNKIDITALSYTHKSLLVKMDSDKHKTIKINLTKKCIKENWSTRRLDEEIKKKLKALQTDPPKSLIRTTQRCIKRIDTVIETVDGSDFTFDSEELTKMSGTRRRELIKHANDLKAKIDQIKLYDISNDCDSLIEELEKIEKEQKENPPRRGRPSSKDGESVENK